MTAAPALPGPAAPTVRARLLEHAAAAPPVPWRLTDWSAVRDTEGTLLGYLIARPDGGLSVVCACGSPVNTEPRMERHALYVHWNMVHKRGRR